MAKKTAQEIVQAAKPGFVCQVVPAAATVTSDATRCVAQSKEAEALMRKYLGKNSPVTAADAASAITAPVETVEVSSKSRSSDGAPTTKRVFVKQQRIIAEQG